MADTHPPEPMEGADHSAFAGLSLTHLDKAFVTFLNDAQPSADARHKRLAALLSQQFGRGHACLDLASLSSDLRAAASSMPWTQGVNSPLVLDAKRLYLRRNWRAEQSILTALRARLQQTCPQPENLAAALDQLFPPDRAQTGPDWQKIACALATRARLTLITGGPGTGKTTTVVRLLALLQSQAISKGVALRIALAAPTGKASARLAESVARAVCLLPEAMQAQLPTQAVTLHKLLKVRGQLADDSPPELAFDLVVVDEASMIDLEMMARLLGAVPLTASLVLLGDKDQLASVEAGAVMAQLCDDAMAGHYNAQTANWLAQHTAMDVRAWTATALEDLAGTPSALGQQTVVLRHSRRFSQDSAIGQWARVVNAGDQGGARRLWQTTPVCSSGLSPSVDRLNLRSAQDGALRALAQAAWQPFLAALQSLDQGACTDVQAQQVLSQFARFQVLCAVREGPWGALSLNRVLALALGLPHEGWYAGRPVMVSRNDYNLQLMNGDVGLCLPHAAGLRVAFADGQGGTRWVLPSRLEAVEDVFAMTVHKSQGSEFEHVCLVLPDQAVAVLTRELLYTGITRAKSRLSLLAPNPEVLLHAVYTKVLRSGGLQAIHESHLS